ncbi:hypothetical protein TrRE_jg4969 [Triparma retinervis]|uniref:Rab-GAP TBC domain-containing protein n=1 Tax=Triparma retinervis TaxID=2557542 RepID=A0A9W7DSD3_9STRA|nr:hypothetical protein TrRE_jg4969 [Triparma retinervis]
MSFFQTIVRSFSTDEGTNEGKNDKIEEKVFIHNAVENGNGTNKDIPGYCGTPTKSDFIKNTANERAKSAELYLNELNLNNAESNDNTVVGESRSLEDGEDSDLEEEGEESASTRELEEEFYVVDKYGFIIEDIDGATGTSGGSRTTRALISEKERKRRADLESSRSIKWVAMITDWQKYSKRQKKLLKRRIRKGVPDSVRGKVWNLVGGVDVSIASNPGRYDRIISLSESYVPNQDIRDTIERDINRTFPRHRMFKDKGEGQDKLRRVLRAYSLYDEEVGYCQGLGFITAMFLTYMPEEQAFWQVVSMMTGPTCNMRAMYEHGMPGAQKALYIGEKLIKKFFPKLTQHFARENCHISMYATQWFMCIFTNSFPFDLVTGVWDCFIAEGWKIVYRIILTFLRYSAPKLFKLGFEGIMFYFKRLPERIDGHTLIQQAFSFPLKQRHVDHYERKFHKLNPDIKERLDEEERRYKEAGGFGMGKGGCAPDTAEYKSPTFEGGMETEKDNLSDIDTVSAARRTSLAAPPYARIRPPAPNFIPPEYLTTQQQTSDSPSPFTA